MHTEFTQHTEAEDALEAQCVELEHVLETVQQETALVKAQRDKAIGETYALSQRSDPHSERLAENIRSLEDALVLTKVECARLSEENESLRDDLQCYQQLGQAKDQELHRLSLELKRHLKQREMLRSEPQGPSHKRLAEGLKFE